MLPANRQVDGSSLAVRSLCVSGGGLVPVLNPVVTHYVPVGCLTLPSNDDFVMPVCEKVAYRFLDPSTYAKWFKFVVIFGGGGDCQKPSHSLDNFVAIQCPPSTSFTRSAR